MPVSTGAPKQETPILFLRRMEAEAMRKTVTAHHRFEQFWTTSRHRAGRMKKCSKPESPSEDSGHHRRNDNRASRTPYKTLGIVFGVGVLVGISGSRQFSGEKRKRNKRFLRPRAASLKCPQLRGCFSSNIFGAVIGCNPSTLLTE